MPLEFRENFQIRAPVDRVWRFLIDPAQVVQCMPGARLIDAEDNRTYRGEITAKVGPVRTTYAGKATFVEVDEAAHRARIVGQGSETSGSGSARLTLDAEVRAAADGGSDVFLSASVDVVGRVMQFGRPMVEGVAKQIIRQFTECARTTVEAVGEAADENAPAAVQPQPAPAPIRPLALLFRALRDLLASFFRRVLRRA